MKALEQLLWSIALPGFGQFLNKKYFKGTVFILLEFLINVQSRFNEAIQLSFLGENIKAAKIIDMQWLMFYPCLYFFAMWDAYKDAGGGKSPYAFLPFVFSAYFVTVGLIYSTHLTFFGIFFGPIWLPMLSVIPGVFIGLAIQALLNRS
ncbi:F0F1-type ATP synthase membrane subunit a [Anoxybacillus voinovskiensis]|uniref:F0F1-type ATP synthase membrane subunit a n=1 Tax=Anoxybacteroides voinovskiense TaxID=230470 RepID=A0A840DTF6_9BACL|nr:hypothetical protein [Anoxybacillus voinovskiensis]MBB4074822.1 F0F1-type ATP synthase membrane subunit a [Anoxybacillus voinovskiensis]GGJ73771.1 hypothetical protein GCM10008982_23700 [Anoxybacillus voinovskiensis]